MNAPMDNLGMSFFKTNKQKPCTSMDDDTHAGVKTWPALKPLPPHPQTNNTVPRLVLGKKTSF